MFCLCPFVHFYANFISISLKERTDIYKLKYSTINPTNETKLNGLGCSFLYCFRPFPLPPLPSCYKRAGYHFFLLVFRNSIFPHEMERSLRVKMFDFDPFGRFLFAAGKYTGHSEQDVARVPTLSRLFAVFVVIFVSPASDVMSIRFPLYSRKMAERGLLT